MAHVNKDPDLPATHTFIHTWWNEPYHSPATKHHHPLADTIFPPAEDRRLSWPGWLITYSDGLQPDDVRSPIPVLTWPDVE